MSISDVATMVNIRSRVAHLPAAQPSALFVRWMLRVVTMIIFVAATVIGIQLATTAPSESPVSTGVSDR